MGSKMWERSRAPFFTSVARVLITTQSLMSVNALTGRAGVPAVDEGKYQ